LPDRFGEPNFGRNGIEILENKRSLVGGELMRKFAIAATCLLLLVPAAWAGAYVGASVGQSDASSAGVGEDETSWKIVGGYTFMKFVGVEGSYRNMGSTDVTFGSTSVGLDVSSMDVFGVGILPIGRTVELFAKAGFAFIDLEASVSDPNFGSMSATDSENEIAYGVGANFKVGSKVAIRAEYEGFNTTENIDMVSMGAVFRF
jgi:opacity protein-like surface antigen